MTRTREENAKDLQLEELTNDRSGDLADDDLFQCVECQSVLDVDESVSRAGSLICELCDEQLKANESTDPVANGVAATAPEKAAIFFGCTFTPESFSYLNEEPEGGVISQEQIARGLAKAEAAFRSASYRMKDEFFEFILDLCEGCIWDEAAANNDEGNTG